MKKILLLIIALSFNTAFSNECKDEAKNYMSKITNTPLVRYKITVTEGHFASEKTVIYSFDDQITNSYQVEMATGDCFLIRISFSGDL